MDITHLLLYVHQLVRCHNLGEIIKRMVMLLAIQDVHLIAGIRIANADIHHKAVELGFW